MRSHNYLKQVSELPSTTQAQGPSLFKKINNVKLCYVVLSILIGWKNMDSQSDYLKQTKFNFNLENFFIVLATFRW